jgi:hypothetical protein
MALKGTLKDFGIADILQLIGQQTKTGTLHLKAKDQEVSVFFKDGSIVKTESSTRKRKDLIGNMLVRAELISEQQLEAALEAQRRTLKRLGDVLVTMNHLSAERFRQMVQLQMTETLYKLFSWKHGHYEFEQGEVEFDADAITPLRAESVLMEGFRMVDEWPLIKKKISSYSMTFQRQNELPPPTAAKDGFDAALDDAFEGKQKQEAAPKGELEISDTERRIYGMAMPGRDVRKLIDLSCVGEFETCKSLLNLVNGGYLLSIAGTGSSDEAVAPSASLFERLGGAAGRVLVTMLVLAGLAYVATRIRFESISLTAAPASSYADPAAQRLISRQQMTRIAAAVDIYRLENDSVPEKLDALVDSGLLAREDLHYPWRDDYYYRRTAPKAFVLLPPLR